jgi:hypothetical protein
MRCEDFAGAYGECMYLLVMAIRPEALPTDAAVLTEMVLALDAENEKLRVAMQTLNIKVGTEGGLITLFGIESNKSWKFFCNTFDCSDADNEPTQTDSE